MKREAAQAVARDAASTSASPLHPPAGTGKSAQLRSPAGARESRHVHALPEPGLPSAALSALARAQANQGSLAEALTSCERWVAIDKLNPACHYLRALVLIEQGDLDEAGRSLQRAVYLQQDFILAHFTLGNLARRRGGTAEAERHFTNTLRLLDACRAEDVLPESDGLTAGRLTATIHATIGSRAAAPSHR